MNWKSGTHMQACKTDCYKVIVMICKDAQGGVIMISRDVQEMEYAIGSEVSPY